MVKIRNIFVLITLIISSNYIHAMPNLNKALSDVEFRAGNSDDIQSGTNERAATTQLCTFDVTDVSTHKIRFNAHS
mgnify:CR=1 FL=1